MVTVRTGRTAWLALGCGLAALLTGCCAWGPPLPAPATLQAPTPIAGSVGLYMCPYTSDDVCADWVDKAINVQAGTAVGVVAGAYAGGKLFEGSPLLGGLYGAHLGAMAGREIAIQASGGWDYIQSTSDLSFDSLGDLAVYLYVKHSHRSNYGPVLRATKQIYPGLRTAYYGAIRSASRQ